MKKLKNIIANCLFAVAAFLAFSAVSDDETFHEGRLYAAFGFAYVSMVMEASAWRHMFNVEETDSPTNDSQP